MDQADLTSLATAKMPASESYGLVNQTRRASVAANIAEGYALRNRAAYLGHLQIAAGSQAELESETEIARRRFLGSDSSVQKLSDVSGRRRNAALIRALQAIDTRQRHAQPRGRCPAPRGCPAFRQKAFAGLNTPPLFCDLWVFGADTASAVTLAG